MIIKNILNKISFHPTLLFVALSAIITGLFKEFIILFLIIIVHEIGHIISALYYKFNINKINLYPFGGYIVFDEKINRALKEEFVILISGPVLQIIFFLIISFIHDLELIRSNTFNMIINYHYSLLFFNLLPIYPLDGSKLFNILMSKAISFKNAHLVMIYTSYLFLFITLLVSNHVSFSINLYLLLILLLLKLIGETKNHGLIYNKFLLERYLYNFNFKKTKFIIGSKLSKMMRDKRHIFIIGNKELTEKEMLRKRYKK